MHGNSFIIHEMTDCNARRHRLGIAICYESWQPWLPQYHSKEKLDAICHLVYDGDFADYPVYTDRMLATIRMRAIETRSWQLVCSTWSGSAVIDPRGNIVKRLGPVQGVLRTDSF
jgi:apolipoprotein N-acyltransferase